VLESEGSKPSNRSKPLKLDYIIRMERGFRVGSIVGYVSCVVKNTNAGRLGDVIVEGRGRARGAKMPRYLCRTRLPPLVGANVLRLGDVSSVTLLDIFQFAGQGTAEPCSAMVAEPCSAVHFGTHLKNV